MTGNENRTAKDYLIPLLKHEDVGMRVQGYSLAAKLKLDGENVVLSLDELQRLQKIFGGDDVQFTKGSVVGEEGPVPPAIHVYRKNPLLNQHEEIGYMRNLPEEILPSPLSAYSISENIRKAYRDVVRKSDDKITFFDRKLM